ncbi:MAG TPA: hypothetical protein VMV94_05805 [Phycisphaerae bacterium]|nr:hypothetical protein [Phycisphaerae bacterium]
MTMSFRYWNFAPTNAATFLLAAVIVAGMHGRVRGGDPLTLIPPDVAGVIAFRDLDATAEKLNRFIKGLNPDSSGIDVAALGEWLDLAPGSWDTSKPVVLILTQPSLDILTEAEFSDTTVVLAFTPKDAARYAAPAGGREDAVRRMERAGREYYVAVRDGVVFCSGKRRVMRMMRGIAPSESFAATLDDQQKELYAKSDLFVHLPMAGWRERINMLALLAGNMMRLGIAVEEDASLMESGRLMLDWSTDGLRSMVEQMESFTLSLAFDADRFRLSHYHTFRSDGSVSKYLRQVKRSGIDLWATLPDRPFYVLAGFDWQCPPDVSVGVRFQDYMLGAEAATERLSPELRQAILEQATACHKQTKGSYLMVTSPPDRLRPVQIIGGYFMENADEGGRQLRFVQENSTEALPGFVGSGHAGKFERRERDGQEYYELRFDPGAMSDGVRRQMSALYGEDFRIQGASVGQNYLMYAMSDDAKFLPEILRTESEGQNVGKNSRVHDIVRCLPPDPHGLVVLDLGRALSAAPYMARLSLDRGEPESRTGKRPPGAATPSAGDEVVVNGPLLGWACVIRPTSFSGHLVISAKDAVETARIARKVAREFPTGAQRVRAAPPAPRPRN